MVRPHLLLGGCVGRALRLCPLNLPDSALTSVAAGPGFGQHTVSPAGESLELSEDMRSSAREVTILLCDLRQVPSPLCAGLVGLRFIFA